MCVCVVTKNFYCGFLIIETSNNKERGEFHSLCIRVYVSVSSLSLSSSHPTFVPYVNIYVRMEESIRSLNQSHKRFRFGQSFLFGSFFLLRRISKDSSLTPSENVETTS